MGEQIPGILEVKECVAPAKLDELIALQKRTNDLLEALFWQGRCATDRTASLTEAAPSAAAEASRRASLQVDLGTPG